MTVRTSAWPGLLASLAVVAAVVLDVDPCYSSRIIMAAPMQPAHTRATAAGTTPSTAVRGTARAPTRPARTLPPVHVAPSHDRSSATSRRVASAKPGALVRDAAPCSSRR